MLEVELSELEASEGAEEASSAPAFPSSCGVLLSFSGVPSLSGSVTSSETSPSGMEEASLPAPFSSWGADSGTELELLVSEEETEEDTLELLEGEREEETEELLELPLFPHPAKETANAAVMAIKIVFFMFCFLLSQWESISFL